jgi:hypothetical protein
MNPLPNDGSYNTDAIAKALWSARNAASASSITGIHLCRVAWSRGNDGAVVTDEATVVASQAEECAHSVD